MKTKRILTMMAAMLLVMSAWAQSNNELLKGNKKSRKVMAVYNGINKYYQDDCPSMRPTGYYVYTLRGTKMKEDFGQSLGIDASTFSEHFEDPVRDSQLDFQQYEEDESGNFVARTNDKYIGHLIVYEDGDLQWRMADADVQKLYERWNQETYKNTEKTYELSVAFKFEDIHGSQSHYDDIFVVFTTSVTFKPFSYVPINVRVDWSNAKINKYWYAKNTTDNGSDEVHITVPPTSADYSSETNYLLSNAFINNEVVSRSIITGNIGFNYNNYNYRLIFHESNNGKKFKGTDGKTYVLRVSDDGRTLLVGTHEIAKLVIPAMFADKEGTTEEANYTTIEYQQSDIAQALLNYCSQEDFKNNNQEKLNNFLNVVVSIAIQNGDYCKPLNVENQSFNVRFIPITQEESVEGKQIFYLKDLFKSDGNEEVKSITIPALTDCDNLSSNRDIQTNLNDRIKPLYQITRLFNLTYHENATLGNYIEYNQSGGFVVQKFNVVIPVEVEYVGGNIVKTTVTLTIGSDDATAKLLLNAANFPDANFRAALATILGISEGDEITAEKIAATTTLNVSRKQIANLTGIEHFTALKYLSCFNNQLTSIDVSKNTALTGLYCHGNQLTSLDVSKNTALTVLHCSGNQLTALDVSKNTALTELGCYYNQLTALDVSKNTKLTTLVCYSNQLTSLDVSKNTALVQFGCDNNQLTALDVSKNTALENLQCYDNQLASLDVSKNTALTGLQCYRNQLTSLDVSQNTALTSLACFGNQLTSLDVSKNTALTHLSCRNNQLTSLNVSNNTALTSLDCSSNRLTSLDVSQNTALKYLYCYGNQIKGEAMDALVASLPTVEYGEFYVIDTKDENEGNVCTKSQVAVAKGKGWTVYDYNGSYSNRQEYEGSDDAAGKLLLNAENFPDANFRAALASILGISEGDEITEAKIAATTSLDVSKSYKTPDEAKIADLTGIEHFTALTKLYCDYNNLTTLDVSKNVKLEYLSCRKIPLASLDLSKNTELLELLLWSNQLTELDLSNNTKLEKLEFGNFANVDFPKNEVSSLNLSKNTALRTMNFQMLGLTSLDVSKNTVLTKLYCYNNQLTSLDVSQNTALTNLRCDRNQLTALDVSNNIALTYLDCYSNQIKGEAMDALVGSLPTVENGEFYVINTKDTNEGNVCTKSQVAVAKGKGWTVYDFNGHSNDSQEYEGSDDPVENIDPVDEDDNIDFGTDMNDGDDLNGNVIGDIFYNIGNGNGEYNAEEGCIVLKKTTDDETVDGLSGKDIFGEDFKGQFTGIVFKVPAGKGTIKVNAETTGNMLLKVKIGSNDPVEMELNGKLKVTFPYNVSETTFVAIYAGANNEAKGFGAPASGDAALKIYGIEFIRDNTPTDINSVDSGELTVDSWYSIDGKKLAGEPKEKGIYIRNGRKVVK